MKIKGKRFSIEIYDTREASSSIVRNVPASSIRAACKKIAEKKGYRWLGLDPSKASYYAIDPEYVSDWYCVRRGSKSLRSKILSLIRLFASGVREFRGLLELFESDTLIEDFE